MVKDSKEDVQKFREIVLVSQEPGVAIQVLSRAGEVRITGRGLTYMMLKSPRDGKKVSI
jgi:hypothetical protein